MVMVTTAKKNTLVRFEGLLTNKATRQQLDGQAHLVVPVTLIREGILNGIFYKNSELAKFPESWNGVPVPVNHPKKGDSFVSANAPEFDESVNIGRIYNAKFDESTGLTAEIWINVEKAERFGFESIITHFDAAQPMEVSTGLFCETAQTTGIWNAKSYNFLAQNIRPDHLALLPTEPGACSLVDGCGAMRANVAAQRTKESAIKTLGTLYGFTANELSFEAIRSKLREALNAKFNPSVLNNDSIYVYMVDVYNDYAIYELGEKFYKVSYSIDESTEIVTIGEPVNVIRKISYQEPESIKVMCEQKKEESAVIAPQNNAAPQLSAEDMALFNQLKANEQKRVDALRGEVSAAFPAMTPAIVANMSAEALEALKASIPAPSSNPGADMSARPGVVATNAQQPEEPKIRTHTPILLA